MEENVTLLAAFGAGLLSFISPCVLPLIPGYLSYISGLSLDEMRGTGRLPAAAPAVAVAAPAEARAAGHPLVARVHPRLLARLRRARRVGERHRPVPDGAADVLGRIAGAIIIIFGLHTMGVLRIEWLYQEKRVQTNATPGRVSSARRSSASRSPSAGRRASGRSSPASSRSRRRRIRSATACGCCRPTRSASACRSSRRRWRSTASSRAFAQDPPPLPQDRARLGRAAGRDRRADLHEQVHDHRAVAHAVPAGLLTLAAGTVHRSRTTDSALSTSGLNIRRRRWRRRSCQRTEARSAA